MDALLNFFSNLILFTAGIVVLAVWIVLIFIAVDEIIDLVIGHFNKNKENES